MNRYVEHLIEDLMNAEAAQIEIRSHLDLLGESEAQENDDDEYDFSCGSTRTAPLSGIIGFKSEVFPPENKLNDDQIEMIYIQLLRVLDNYNFFLDFPDQVITRIKYKMIIDILDDETTYSNVFVTSLEFCDYDYETCPFGLELCQCKIFEERC